MYVLLAGLNHRTAPVEVREKLAFSGGMMGKGLPVSAAMR
jgi:glutamyl-tRNA reductase